MSQSKHFISHVKTPRGSLLLICALGALVLAAGGFRDRAEAETALIAMGQPGTTTNTARRAVSPAEIAALVADPAIRDFKGLAENDWNFNDPLGVPGFGTVPSIASEYPVVWR